MPNLHRRPAYSALSSVTPPTCPRLPVLLSPAGQNAVNDDDLTSAVLQQLAVLSSSLLGEGVQLDALSAVCGLLCRLQQGVFRSWISLRHTDAATFFCGLAA